MRAQFVLAALAAATLFAAPALAHGPAAVQSDAPHADPVQAYPGHWGGPFGLWYGGWLPQTVVNLPAPNAPGASAGWSGGYDRDGWLRECRRRLGEDRAPVGRVENGHPGPDRCEAMLAAPPAGAHAMAGVVYAVPVMLVPVGLGPVAGLAKAQPATTTVVTEDFIEEAPRRGRHILRQATPTKRMRIEPDKRIAQ